MVVTVGAESALKTILRQHMHAKPWHGGSQEATQPVVSRFSAG